MEEELDFILINPPSPSGKVSNKDMMGGFGQLYNSLNGREDTKIPVIDLAYICAECKKNKLKFFAIDGLIENLQFEDIIERIKERIPKYIFIRTSTSSFYWDITLIKFIKRHFSIPIFLLGPHVQQKSEECIKVKEIFGLIVSEPEVTIPEIFIKGLKKTKGVWYKENNKIIRTERKLVEELDNLSYPAWEYFPYLDYNLGEQINNQQPFVTVLTSRGCPYSCMYCPYPIGQGTKWRARSAQNVLGELQALIDFYGVKGILFRDAVFTLDRNRIEEICKGIIRLNVQVSWRCETRIDCLDVDLIKLMKKAGCIGINIGMESLSDKVLNFLGTRPKNMNKIGEICAICDKLQINLFLFFIIGLPYETRQSILRTVSIVRKLNPSYVQFTHATPYPGTGLERWVKSKGYLLEEDLSKVTGYSSIMKNDDMGPKMISELSKFANLYSQTGVKNILKRIKRRGVSQIVHEVAKILLSAYYYFRINTMDEKK